MKHPINETGNELRSLSTEEKERQDEHEMERLLKRRDELVTELNALNEEITARAQLMRLSR